MERLRMNIKQSVRQWIPIVMLAILFLLSLACGKSAAITPTLRPPTASSSPLPPTHNPSPTVTIPTIEPTNPIEIVVDVPGILGKSVSEVENLIGESTLITPNDDNDDNLAGGEYRDYQIDRYTVSIAYDKTGIARVFFILDGMSDENYALEDWNIILPKFGVQIGVSPDRKALLAVYWDNYNGYFIAVAGDPVWTVQIAEYKYHP